MWSEFFSSTSEHLQPTASLVKSTVLGSKESTWEVLEDGNVGLQPITSPSFLLISLRSQYLQDANSPSPVLNPVYSIDWAQNMAGLSKISNHPLVSLMVSASQRLLGRAKVNSYLLISRSLGIYLVYVLFFCLSIAPGFFLGFCYNKLSEVFFILCMLVGSSPGSVFFVGRFCHICLCHCRFGVTQ